MSQKPSFSIDASFEGLLPEKLSVSFPLHQIFKSLAEGKAERHDMAIKLANDLRENATNAFAAMEDKNTYDLAVKELEDFTLAEQKLGKFQSQGNTTIDLVVTKPLMPQLLKLAV